MKNKQLDTKDLLMNKKEELIWRVIDNVINCCAVTRIDGAKSITREDVVGKSREENVVLTTRDSNGTEMALEPITREQLDNMMKQSNVHLTNNDNPYDAVFVANMCKADYLGSSVPDGLHLCLYVKDVIDDVDGYDGIAFNRWYADMCRKGIQVDWYNCR